MIGADDWPQDDDRDPYFRFATEPLVRRKVAGTNRQLGIPRVPLITVQRPNQIPERTCIQSENHQLYPGEMQEKLVDLKRNKQACYRDGQILAPFLTEDQTDAFRESQSRVEEGARADFTKLLMADRESPRQYCMDVSVIRVHTKHMHPMHQYRLDIAVEQANRTDARRYQ